MKINRMLVALVLVLAMVLVGCGSGGGSSSAASLPKPSDVEGDYTVDTANINNTNFLDYLNREDSVYIDLRDYSDYAKKHFKNFEVLPYFGFIFNEAAGTEGNPQLYKGTVDDPIAVYEASEAILNTMFPKDKNIMLMCQSGGRVEMMMKILAANGYDMSKVYNIGGMAQYTDDKYRDYITDTEELTVEAVYIVDAKAV